MAKISMSEYPVRESTRMRYERGLSKGLAPRSLGAALMPPAERTLADGNGIPKRVWMAVEFQQIFDIDMKGESFAFEVLVKLIWRCPNDSAEEAFQPPSAILLA